MLKPFPVLRVRACLVSCNIIPFRLKKKILLLCLHIKGVYNRLAEGPGVARGKKVVNKIEEKNWNFLAYDTSRPPMCPKKNQPFPLFVEKPFTRKMCLFNLEK